MIVKTVRLGLSIIFVISFFACNPAPSPEPTAIPTPTVTTVPPTSTAIPPTPTFTPAPTATITPKPSPTPNIKATEQYIAMENKVQDFSKLGYVSRTAGEYRNLKPFSGEWAQMDWYSWVPIEIMITDDFVIRTDVSWNSASKTPNTSGCGFVFRLQPNDDHYVVVLGLDGYVIAAHNINNNWKTMGHIYYGKSELNGKANLSLIVENNTFSVIVNDKLIKKFTGFDGKLSSGDLAYTVLSGTNKDYGTHCSFENTHLWRIADD